MIINDIQFTVELEYILEELVNQLRANGSSLIQKRVNGPTHIQICCPYHANGIERRPSAGIRKKDGVFHCFACGEVHSLQEVISYCFGHTDDIFGIFGWQWLLKNFATIQVEERKDVELDLSRSGLYSKITGNSRSIDRNNYNFVTEEELNKYRYIHPYMYKRGLTDEIIDLFDIGYDDTSKCITFPVRDIKGNCLFIARRSVYTKYFNYPEGVEKPLYGLYEYFQYRSSLAEKFRLHPKGWSFLDCVNTMIVCESMLDALSFWVVGKCAVALNGLGNELQFRQLRELPCRQIILATDMDERGLAARKRIRQNLQNTKIVKEYIFPKGRKDANDCTKEELMSLQAVF